MTTANPEANRAGKTQQEPRRRDIALLEDHSAVRSGIRAILEEEGGYTVRGEASTGKEALAKFPALQPGIILLDISLPDMSGLDALRQLKAGCPSAFFAILSMHNRIDYIEEFLKEGVKGYLTKASDKEVLLLGLNLIQQGEYFLDRYAMEKIVQRINRAPSRFINHSQERYNHLTRREQEVFRLLAQGFTTKQVGFQLKISHRTVENHKSTLMRKLDLETSVDLLRYAQQIGIMSD